MAIAIDSSIIGSGGSSVVLNAGGGLDTSGTNRLIILAVYHNASTNTAFPTASSPNLGSFTLRGRTTTTPNGIFELYAVAPTALTNEVITVTGGTGAAYMECVAAAFSGCDVSTIEHWTGTLGDASMALPTYSDGGVGVSDGTIHQGVGFLTTNADDLLLCFARGYPNPPSSADPDGWIRIPGPAYLMYQYKIVSSAGLYQPISPGGHNGIMVDAFKAAGSPAHQSQMKIGFNTADIAGPGPGSKEHAFLNLAKTGGEWRGTGGGATITDNSLLDLDTLGYPKSMARPDSGNFTGIDCEFMSGFKPVSLPGYGTLAGSGFAEFGYYPSGRYVFLWDGTGSFSVEGDATDTFSGTNGRRILNVTPTGLGFRIYVRSTSAAPNNTRNFRLIYSPNSDAAHLGGGHSDFVGTNESLHEVDKQVANTYFKDRFSFNSCLRMMPWMNTVHCKVTVDPDPPPNSALWFGDIGPPMEAMVAVCNDLNCDIWINIPALLRDEDIETMAQTIYGGSTDSYGRVWAGLNSNLNVRVEYCNEIFLSPSAVTELENAGHDAFPSLPYSPGNLSINYPNRQHYGLLRQIQANRIFRTKWVALGGDPSRHIRILASSINSGQARAALMNATAAFIPDGVTGSTGAYTFSTTNGSISGTTFTPGAGLTGTVHIHQELTGAGIPDATYIQESNGDGTWRLNKNCGTIGAQTITGEYWTGAAIQAGDNTDYDKYFDEYCTAPYMAATYDQFGTVDDFFAANSAGGIPYTGLALDIATCCNPDYGRGIPYVTYEGGQGYYGRSDDLHPGTQNDYDPERDLIQYQAQVDPRMEDAYDVMLDAIGKSGCRLFVHYTTADEDRSFAHYFGAMRSIFLEPFIGNTPKYDALFNFAEGITSIELSPTSLSNGTAGVAYSQTVTTSGGTVPYTYSILSGALPTGLSINGSSGAITGTPSAPGTFAFTIQAEDADTNTGGRSYSVTIAAATSPRGDAPKGKGRKKMHFYH